MLVLHGAEDVINGDFEWCELFFSVGLCLISRGLFVDGAGSPILALLGCSKLWLQLFPLTVVFRGVVGCASCRIFNLDVLLDPEEDVPHLVDFVFHQVLIKGVGDWQPTDEHCHCNVFVAVIYQSHLTLEITDVVLKALLGLHLDGEEVITVLLEFMSGYKLIREGFPHLLEVSKRVARKRVEPVVGDPLKLEGNTRLMRRSSCE